MQHLAEQIQQEVRITQDTVLKERIDGVITVASGTRLELYGILMGDLYLEPDSDVILYSILKGSVYNQGGNLRIEGVVKGQVYRQGGNTVLSPQAMVDQLL